MSRFARADLAVSEELGVPGERLAGLIAETDEAGSVRQRAGRLRKRALRSTSEPDRRHTFKKQHASKGTDRAAKRKKSAAKKRVPKEACKKSAKMGTKRRP